MTKMITKMFRGATAAATVLLTTTLASADVRLQGAGATFPAPIYQRWVTEYQTQHPEVKIDYQSIGSGGGIKGITEKTIDFGASDAPLSKKELAAVGGAEKVVQIPTVAGAVVLSYNLPDFKGELKLDGPTTADIFLGKITQWNDPKIAALNEGTQLPDLGITTVHRTDGSGTNFVFTSYLSTQSEEFKEKVGAAKQVEWPAKGQGGKGSEGVTQVLQQTKGSLAYVEIAYAKNNNLPFASLKNKDGKFVKASPESVSAAGEGATKEMEKGLAVDIWNQSGANAYPISAFTYIIVYKDLGYLKDEAKAKALVEFLTWATGDGGQSLASSMDYAPLAAGVREKVKAAIAGLEWSGKPLASAAAK